MGVVQPTPRPEDDSPRLEDSAVESPQWEGGSQAAIDWEGLPEPIKARLAELSASALADIRSADIPAQLRPVVRFAPTKRAKLGSALLVAALRDSAVFRTAVVNWCRDHQPDALELDHADAMMVAVAAILRESPIAVHYAELIGHRVAQGRLRGQRDSAVARAEKLAVEAERLRAELEDAKVAIENAGAQSSSEADRLRKRLREKGMQLKEAKDAAQQATEDRDRLREQAEGEIAGITAERDRERARVQEERGRAERALSDAEIARQAAREARQGDEVRLSLLLDTLEGALGGLRRELRATGSGPRPADAVRGVRSHAGPGNEITDPAVLDRLLALPAVHLIVDGYNVTKTGYPDLPLADQRDRLAHQLAALAARTGAEVTVVFDGADVLAVPASGPRGVRVLFSDPGVQADDVIRALVAAEPEGRQVVVATSDRAVVTSVRSSGAYAVASAVLLARVYRA